MRRNLILIVVALAAILATTLLLDDRQPPVTTTADHPEVKTLPASAAPDFEFIPHGAKTPLKLSSYRGKTVLLNFWASWCAPCIIEFPKLQELARRHPDTLIVLAVSADSEAQDMTRFLTRIKFRAQPNFIIVHDPAKAISQDLFQTIRLPETIIVDPAGLMVRKVVGDTDWTGAEMDKLLSGLAQP